MCIFGYCFALLLIVKAKNLIMIAKKRHTLLYFVCVCVCTLHCCCASGMDYIELGICSQANSTERPRGVYETFSAEFNDPEIMCVHISRSHDQNDSAILRQHNGAAGVGFVSPGSAVSLPTSPAISAHQPSNPPFSPSMASPTKRLLQQPPT